MNTRSSLCAPKCERISCSDYCELKSGPVYDMAVLGFRATMMAHNNHAPLLIGVAFGALPLLAYSITNYREWLSIGPGGLPYNVVGWVGNVLLRPLSRSDVRAVAPYVMEEQQEQYGAAGSLSFFDTARDSSHPLPPPRDGARPTVPTFVAPQRQTSDCGTAASLEEQQAYLARLASANPTVFCLKPSGLEGPGHDALFLAQAVPLPPVLRRTKGEFIHIHGEGSTHAVFSLTDAARLIERGWAERHKLAGVKGFMPWSYLMLYAPRNAGELENWRNMAVSAARFNAAAAGVPDIHVPE